MKTRSTDLPRTRGFTLVEMMITIAVMALVLSLAVPSFTNMIRNNRLASGSNELISALTYARSEAVKRRLNVSVCARDGDACSTDVNNWGQGWLIFTDDLAPSGQLDTPGDALLLSADPSESGVQITGELAAVTFNPLGEADLPDTAEFTVTKSGCKGNNERRLTVQSTGRLSLARRQCS
jgi:type IV fimbrial biogenesis protein FimT